MEEKEQIDGGSGINSGGNFQVYSRGVFYPPAPTTVSEFRGSRIVLY